CAKPILRASKPIWEKTVWRDSWNITGATPMLSASKVWDPSWDSRAIVLVFLPKFGAQCWLFIKEHEAKKCQPDHEPVFKKRDASAKQSLSQDQRQQCHVHGISHVAIKPGDDQVLGRRNGRRCPQALDGEAREGIEEDGQAREDYQPSQNPKWEKAKQWSS